MSDDWTVQDLLDGRLGIFKNGLCRAVVKTKEEAREWFNKRASGTTDDKDALVRAIHKLR